MNKRNQNIDKAIDNYLSGRLDDSECTFLLNWLDKNRENIKYFRNYAANWQSPGSDSIEKSWNALKVQRRLRESNLELETISKPSWGSKMIRFSRVQFIKYVAILIGGLIISFLFTEKLSDFFGNRAEKQWVYAETMAGQKTKIVLPDSSVVWLNSESVLSFPSYFNSRRNRVVKLQGEAYFDVVNHNNSKFTVQCPDYDIEVKGTQFNVMAYKDFNRTETTLVEGEVSVVKGNQRMILKPGERAIYSKNYFTKSKAHIRQATLWKENKFYFDNVPFKELARRLERWYDVKITMDDPSLNDIYYSGYFKNEETVWQVLDVIQMTTPIVYERKQFREISIEGRMN